MNQTKKILILGLHLIIRNFLKKFYFIFLFFLKEWSLRLHFCPSKQVGIIFKFN